MYFCFKLTTEDFLESIRVLDFSAELSEELVKNYNEARDEICTILTQMSLAMPQYHDLEWRFDIQV